MPQCAAPFVVNNTGLSTNKMNIRNTTAKEKMLKRIRQALLHKRDNPYPDFEDSPLYPDEENPLDVKFAKEFTQAGGNFIYVEGEINLIESLITLVEKLKISKLGVFEAPIQQFLNTYGFPFTNNINDVSNLPAVVTTCEALIARNGGVVVAEQPLENQDLLGAAQHHIVIAKASQLVMDYKHAFQKLTSKYGNRLPASVTAFVGNPTTLLQNHIPLDGGYSPSKRYVFLIEDRF